MLNISQIFSVFEQIGATRSRNAKIAWMKKLCEDPDAKQFVLDVCKIMWDSYVTYDLTLDIKKLVPVADPKPFASDSNAWQIFKFDLARIVQGRLSGDAAKEQLLRFISTLPLDWQPWFIRITNRDWRISFGYSSMVKVVGEFMKFHAQELCVDWGGEEFSTPQLIEPKINGLRAEIGKIHLYRTEEFLPLSRNGLPFSAVNTSAVVHALAMQKHSEEFVFDGEFYVDDEHAPLDETQEQKFALTQSILTTLDVHPLRHRLVFYLFDVIPLEDWLKYKCEQTLMERKVNVCAFQNLPEIIPVMGEEAVTRDRALEIYNDLVPKWEGIVVKDPDGLYTWTRGGANWRRKKFQADEDLVVNAVTFGYLDLATGMVYDINTDEVAIPKGSQRICRQLHCGYYEEDSAPEVSIGTGWTDQQSMQWAANAGADILGKVVKFRHNGVLTQGGRRHPRFLEVRKDKEAKDVVRS